MNAATTQSAGLTEYAFSKTSPLDQNPENGGTPAMENHPMRKVIAVSGMNFASAPMRLMFCSSSMPWMTDPAPKNNSAL